MNTLNLRLFIIASTAALLFFLPDNSKAQTVFNNGGADSSWSDPTNWTAGSPATIGPGAVVQIGNQPSSNLIAVDTGITTNTIASLTFNNTLTGPLTIEALNFEQLTVGGSITNSSSFLQTFTLPVTAGANATYTGGSGGLAFNNGLTVGTFNIATSGTVTVGGGLVFTANSTAPGPGTLAYGTIGPITTSSQTSISIDGTYTTNATLAADAGDFFKLTSGGGTFAGATASSLPAFTDTGLTWISSLIQKGVLFVEPTAGGNIINTGVVLPVGNDTEFNTGGIIFNGGELLTSDDTSLDTGGTVGTAFSTSRAVTINLGSSGTIAAGAGSTATYNGVIADQTGAGAAGTLTIGDASGGTGTVVFTATNTYQGPTTITSGTLEVDGSLAANSTVAVETAGTLTGAGTVNGNATLTGNGAINFTNPGTITGTLGVTGGNWNGAGSVTGLVTSSSGTFTIGSSADLTANGGLNVTGGSIAGGGSTSTITGSVDYTSSTGSTFNGIIAGAGKTLTMNSSGVTLNLGGANSYTGPTSIMAGTLALGGTGSLGNTAVTISNGATLAALGTSNTIGGGITVNSGGIVNLQNGVTNTLNGSTLALNGAGALTIDIGSPGSSDLIHLTGAASLGANPFTVNVDSLTGAATGTQYTFFSATGGLTLADFAAGTLTGSLAGDVLTFGGGGTSIFLQINSAAGTSFYYTGATSTDFTDETNYTTTAGGGVVQSTPLSATSNVYIGASTPTPSNLTPALGSNLTINTLTFTPAGSGATLSGAGTLTIGGGVTVAMDATGTETISAPVALGSTQAWMVTDVGSTLLDSGGISGAFGLMKTGLGTLILSGADTYTGATTISAGAVNLQSNGALGTGAGTSSSGVNVASGAALQLQGTISTTTAVALTLNGTGLAASPNGALENVSGTNTYSGLVTLGSAATIGSDAGMLTLSNTGTITGNGFDLTLAGAGNGSLAGIIGTGAGTLTLSGSGTWTLTGANTFTGATTIDGGTLTLGAGGSVADSSEIDLANSGTTFDLSAAGNQTIKDLVGVAGTTVNLGTNGLTEGTSNSTTFAGAIHGGGGVTKVGTGTLTLSGTNDYSEGTTINGGIVKVSTVDTNLGGGNLTLGGGELLTTTTSSTSKTITLNAGTNTLAAGAPSSATYAGVVGGTGSLSIGDASDSGTVIFTANNTYNGTTTVFAGSTAQFGNGVGVGGSAGAGGIIDNGTVAFDHANNITVGNNISGAGTLVQAGGGTATISGTNSFMGGTTISDGILSVTSIDTNLGTGNLTLGGGELLTTGANPSTSKTVTLNAGTDTLAAAAGTTVTYNGAVGGGALVAGDGTNTGTIILAATNTYSGGTTISSGTTLQLGNGGANGSPGSGPIVDQGSLVIDRTGAINDNGIVISGSGNVVKEASGTFTVTAADTYLGSTSITGGTLALSGTGSLGATAVTVGNGATLAALGTGNSIGGGIAINSGGTVNLQNGTTNTLNGSTLTLAGGTGTLSIDVGPAGASDEIDLTGAASLGADLFTVNVDSLNGATAGTQYTFFSATGGLTLADFTAGALTGALAGDTLTFGGGGSSVFVEINSIPVNSYFYTGATSTDFTNLANFNTTAGGGVVQSTPFSASSNVYIGTSTPTPSNLNPVLGSNETINTLAFTPTGSGATLSGAGTLTIEAGVTVEMGVAGTETISAPVALGGSQAWTVMDADSTLVDSGGISGAFGLMKAGLGTLTLSGADTYTGPTTVSAGAVDLQSGSALGTGVGTSSSGVNVADGAALQLQGNISTTTAVALTLNGAGLAASPNGALENVSGSNTYSGLVTLGSDSTIGSDANTLTLSNTGTITGNGFGLTLTGAGNGSIASVIGTGAGTVTKTGNGTWTLNGANTYSGGTIVSSGTLAIGGSGTLGSTTSDLTVSGGTLDLGTTSQTVGAVSITGPGTIEDGSLTGTSYADSAASGSATISAVLEGTAGLTKSGAGTLVLSGANSYDGGTTLDSGTLQLSGSGTLGSATNGLTVAGGTLDLGATTQTVGAVSITGASTIEDGTLSGTSFADSAGATTMISAALSGAGELTKSGGGTLILNGANNYSGGTLISGGTVQVGSAMALGSSFVTNNGTLETVGAQHVINVMGAYAQSGTLVINLNGVPNVGGLNAANDLLHATGAATLNGTLSLKFNFQPTTGQVFEVVEADGGINGTPGPNFSGPAVAPVGVAVTTSESMSLDDFLVTVTSAQMALTTIPGLTPNQSSTATYVDTHIPTGTPLATALGNAAQGSPTTLANALDQLTPEKFGNFTRSSIFNNAAFTTQIFDSYLENQLSLDGEFRASDGQVDSSGLTVVDPTMDPGLAQVSSRLLAWSPAPLAHGLLSDTADPVLAGLDMKDMTSTLAPERSRDFDVFVLGNVILAQDFSQADVPHADSTTGAVQIGADYRITPHLRVGALFGYGHTDADLDDIGSKASVDSYSPGAFVSYAEKGWYANAVGSYGFDSFTEDRHVAFGGLSGTAHGAPGGDQIVGDIDGGYDFHWKKWTFGPLAGVQYTHLDVDSYSESGSAPVDLSVNKEETDSLRSRLGGHISYDFVVAKLVLRPHLDASWQHEFLDQSRGVTSQFNSVGAGSFSIATPNPSRDSALIDGGLTADLSGTVSIYFDYLIQAGQDNYFGQAVQGGVKVGF